MNASAALAGAAERYGKTRLEAAAHDRCLYVHPYTVNERRETRALISVGVDGMFSNEAGRKAVS